MGVIIYIDISMNQIPATIICCGFVILFLSFVFNKLYSIDFFLFV